MIKRSTWAAVWIGFSVAAIFAGCKGKTGEVEQVGVPVLRASYIYSGDSVQAYIRNYGAEHAVMAKYYFNKGEKLIETDPQKAIWNIKRAITLHPLLEYYKKLGPLLMDMEDYDEAESLYGIVADKVSVRNGSSDYNYTETYIFDRPTEDDYYNYFICSMLRYSYFPFDMIYEARERGFDIQKLKQRLLSDQRYKYDTGSVEFKNNMLAFLSEDEIKAYCDQPENFQKFIHSITDTSTSFIIDQGAVSDFNYMRYYQYEGGNDGYSLRGIEVNFLKEQKDKPDGWFLYNCNHIARLNDQVYVLVYAIDTSAIGCPKEMRHVSHTLATYTPEGKIIDTKVVAWQAGAELASFAYENGTFIINTYQRTWKESYNKKAFDNELLKTEASGQSHFVINPDGKITQEEQAPL